MSTLKPSESALLLQSDQKIEALKQQARDLAQSVEIVRQRTLLHSNERIEALEQKARDLAWFVETTRQRTLLQSDKKSEALEQKARDLAALVETLQSQTRVQSESEVETLGLKARELALFVESVRKETRLQSEEEIEALGQRARDLAISVEAVREKTSQQSDWEITQLAQKARDFAASMENVRERTLQETDQQIAKLEQQAGAEIEALKLQARNLAVSVEQSRLETLIESDKVMRKLNEELEQRVLERTGQLESANKELESFSYSVSHDLRAPLRAIDGFTRIVLEEHCSAMAPEGKAYLEMVRASTRKMGTLVDDLLGFSRLGRQGLSKITVDSNKMIGLCQTELGKELEGRKLELVIGNLPSCQADPALLKQVWLNLLSNAIKYTRKTANARIEIGSQVIPRPSRAGLGFPLTDETIFFIKDNGAGFDMKYASKLFGVFQRLHRAADYEGTGVGLAIVQRIVDRHGGRIWANAQPNQGASFSFTLA